MNLMYLSSAVHVCPTWERDDRLVTLRLAIWHVSSLPLEQQRALSACMPEGYCSISRACFHPQCGCPAQIVANGRNGLDVDKFDYLQRDSLYCNVKINADFDRLQKLSKVALTLS